MICLVSKGFNLFTKLRKYNLSEFPIAETLAHLYERWECIYLCVCIWKAATEAGPDGEAALATHGTFCCSDGLWATS